MISNKLILYLSLLLGSLRLASAAEDQPRLLQFAQPVVEVGTVRFDAGKVAASFECENIASEPVTILEVRSQCGCVVAEFSRKALKPGEKTVIRAVLDPSGTYGEQKRYLTVVATNGSYRRLNTLQMHGYVQRDQTESEIRFPCHIGGGLRTELCTVGLRRRTAGEQIRRSVVLYNDSDAPMRLSWKAGRRVKGSWKKTSLAPGERTTLEFVYDTRGLSAGDYTDELQFFLGKKRLGAVELKGTIE